jgi:hypothetical protein
MHTRRAGHVVAPPLNCGVSRLLMANQSPPPVLDSARVVSYASVHDIPYRRWGALIVGGKPLEHVPRLAICANLAEDGALGLFHCGDQWNVLGCTGGDAVHDRYVAIYELLQTRDKELARAFDDLKRSQAITQLAVMWSLGLLTEVELQQFSVETQAAVGHITGGGIKRGASA